MFGVLAGLPRKVLSLKTFSGFHSHTTWIALELFNIQKCLYPVNTSLNLKLIIQVPYFVIWCHLMNGRVPFLWFSNKMMLQGFLHQHLHQIQLKTLFWNLKTVIRILTWEVPLHNALVNFTIDILKLIGFSNSLFFTVYFKSFTQLSHCNFLEF